MKKILLIFGTRPEAIKMAPLAHELFKYPSNFEVKICVTAQHREMLDQVLSFFNILPDYDLNLMRPDQNLYQLSADLLLKVKGVLEDFRPDYVCVHGDTTTSMISSLASFYFGSKVCHIEAGLRTFNKLSPFPEEINRQLTGRIADLHFSPTITSKKNLLSEGINADNINVVGNTVIDALYLAIDKLNTYKDEEIRRLDQVIDRSKKVVLVTGHRRENFGIGFTNICNAILELAKRDDVQIIYPVHLNPNVKGPVFDLLANVDNILLIEPLGYPGFVYLMRESYLILTDSGGVQEEAPSLGKPVIVMRDNTERPEAVDAGTVILTGTDAEKIVTEVERLLDDPKRYSDVSMAHNPYGDGTASYQIAQLLKSSE